MMAKLLNTRWSGAALAALILATAPALADDFRRIRSP
jgi:hypothetical protein